METNKVFTENKFFDFVKDKSKKIKQKAGEQILSASALAAGIGANLLKNKSKKRK